MSYVELFLDLGPSSRWYDDSVLPEYASIVNTKFMLTVLIWLKINVSGVLPTFQNKSADFGSTGSRSVHVLI